MPRALPAELPTITASERRLHLGRFSHGIATLGTCDRGHLAIIYGGYAAVTSKFDVQTAGGFASGLPIYVHHSSSGALERGRLAQAAVPGCDRTHQPWALCDPRAHQPRATCGPRAICGSRATSPGPHVVIDLQAEVCGLMAS